MGRPYVAAIAYDPRARLGWDCSYLAVVLAVGCVAVAAVGVVEMVEEVVGAAAAAAAIVAVADAHLPASVVAFAIGSIRVS